VFLPADGGGPTAMSNRGASALWFVGLPRLVARRSRSLAHLLADGHFLLVQPWVAAAATPAPLLIGLVWGALTLDYDRVFSESLPLILVACIFGFLSTNLGVAFVIGFAFGDFFVGETRWSVEFSAHPEAFANEGLLAALVRLRAPMLIGYLLLFVLAVYIPRLARLLILDIPQTTRLPKNYAVAVASLLNITIVAIFVRLWAEAAAVLMRPLFTWRFQEPTVAAAYALQMQSGWIVLAAITATCLRFAVIWAAYLSPTSTQTIMAAEKDLAQAIPNQKKPKRAGKVTAALAAATISTAALSGLFDNWLIPVVAFAVFCTLHLVRKNIIPLPMEWWKRLVAKVPLLIRMGIGFIIISSLRDAFAGEYDNNFAPLASYLLGSIVLLVVLLPGPPLDSTAGTAVRP
jgi:hypothetical protein